MPGPMSIPNSSTKTHKIVEGQGKDRVVRWVSTIDLTGEQRVHLAGRKMLDTGKTAMKKEKKQ